MMSQFTYFTGASAHYESKGERHLLSQSASERSSRTSLASFTSSEKRETQSSSGNRWGSQLKIDKTGPEQRWAERRKHARLKFPPVDVSNLDSDFELEGSAMRVPQCESPRPVVKLKEGKRAAIHVELADTASNASHASDLHGFCEIQLRDARDREMRSKAKIHKLEKLLGEMKTVLEAKDEELQDSKAKIDKLEKSHSAESKAKDDLQSENVILKEKINLRGKRIEQLFHTYQQEMKSLKEAHQLELDSRDLKLENLKFQLENSMDRKSWERYEQMEELSRELVRVTREAESMKAALKDSKQKSEHEPYARTGDADDYGITG